MEKAILSISKLDAARRQLEAAVRLYFFHGDPVSIHTLGSAAAQILHDLAKHRGEEPIMLRQVILKYVRPEHHALVERTLAEAENFFKHADRDPVGLLEFKLAQTELVLLDAVEAYSRLTAEQIPLFTVYRMWFFVGPGSDFVMPAELEAVKNGGQRVFNTSSREAFFSDALPVAESLAVQPSGSNSVRR